MTGEGESHTRKIPRRGWLLLLPGIALGSAFLSNVTRYYFVSDDCFISLRYARNLVAGHGLVYNPGEHVEGYTNFLWVLLSALFMKLGIDPELPMNLLGIASGALILGIVLRLGLRRFGWSSPLAWIAPFCLALNRTFCAWCTAGLETQLFSMLVLAGLLVFLAELQNERSGRFGSALLLAAATLTRPEGALFFTLAACFGAVELLRRRQGAVRLATWIGIYVVVVGGHLAWRLAYYGHPLPNTFYAKVSGFWWDQSSIWFELFLQQHHLVWFLPLLLLAFAFRRRRTDVLFGAVLAAYVGYLIYIGGDQFEFRLMTPVLPILFWLLQAGIGEAVRLGRERIRLGRAATVLGLLCGTWLAVSSWQPNRHGFPMTAGIISVEEFANYTAGRREQGMFLRHLVERGYLTGDEVLSVGGAGALPYFSGLYTIDFRGLNDERVARQKVTRRKWIAHEKAAPFEYLARRRVAIWDVENMVVRPRGTHLPRPHGIHRDFYRGPVCGLEAEGRYLVFATTLSEPEFRRTFSRFRILFYGDPRLRAR